MKPISSESALPPVFAPVLRRLREDAPDALGAADMRVQVVGYQARPFSNVARLRLTAADGSPAGFCFAKIQIPKAIPDAAAHMSRRVLHEFETTAKVARCLSSRPGVVTVQPMVCYPELFAIVTREVQGTTLLNYLEARVSWWAGASARSEAERAAAQAGAWIRAFQAIDRSEDLIDLEDLREYIDLRLRRLVSSGQSPITQAVRDRCLKHIDELSAAVLPAERRSVIVHADLAPGNVIVTGEGVAVLDFAMASRGTLLQDLVRLTLQIDLLRGKPQFRPDAIGRVTSALRRGFAPDLVVGHPLYRLLLIRHRVTHLTTLTVKPLRGLRGLYQRRLRWMHERSIMHELATPVGASAMPPLDATAEH